MTGALRGVTTVLITDVDNTLFDWVDVWHSSFRAMLAELVRLSGVAEEVLISEIKGVHQEYGTSEYSFLVDEVPSLVRAAAGTPPAQFYAQAIAKYREARRGRLRLYPGVKDTLAEVKRRGCSVVAYTESMSFYSNYRLLRLGLDGLVDVLYSPPNHELPARMTVEQAHRYPAWHHEFERTINRYTPPGELKPNPLIMLQLLADVGVDAANAVYVGDSPSKDVVMAQTAGVPDVWAAYGSAHNRPEYELLRAVTHWTPETVERERALSGVDANPSHTLDWGFSQLLTMFNFSGARASLNHTATSWESRR